MHLKPWSGVNRRITVCVDSYENGILKGRYYNSCREMGHFESLMQLLLAVENILEDWQQPQSYTALRRFADLPPVGGGAVDVRQISRGRKATFELQVLFRQHTSWQGTVIWREKKREQSFRSVLELALLMDSALQNG